MARGPKKHLKRINTPRSWLLSKMGGVYSVRPSQGPHKLRDCLPLSIIIRYLSSHLERDLISLSQVVKSHWQSWIKKEDSRLTTKPEEMLDSQLVLWMFFQSSRQTNTTECYMMLKADLLSSQSKILKLNSSF